MLRVSGEAARSAEYANDGIDQAATERVAYAAEHCVQDDLGHGSKTSVRTGC